MRERRRLTERERQEIQARAEEAARQSFKKLGPRIVREIRALHRKWEVNRE